MTTDCPDAIRELIRHGHPPEEVQAMAKAAREFSNQEHTGSMFRDNLGRRDDQAQLSAPARQLPSPTEAEGIEILIDGRWVLVEAKK